MLLSHREVECHTDSGAVFPFNTSTECCLSLHFNMLWELHNQFMLAQEWRH